MSLVRRYGHLVLKFTPHYLSSSGRYEASWIGGHAEGGTEPELLAVVRGDGRLRRGGAPALSLFGHQKGDDVFVIQELKCDDCPTR